MALFPCRLNFIVCWSVRDRAPFVWLAEKTLKKWDLTPTIKRLSEILLMTTPLENETLETGFERRLRQLGTDLKDSLSVLYPDNTDLQIWYDKLVNVARRAFEERPDTLRALDESRQRSNTTWFQSEKMLGYMCYPDRFATDFRGLRAKIPYLQDLGVTYLHLLSVLKARDGDNDGGFAIEDYLSTNAKLGTIDDLETLTADMRQAGIALCLDFALNHTAQEHDWARRAAAGDEDYQNHYYFFPDRSGPDEQEPLLEQVFPATAPGNFTYVEACDKWVWTTFYPYQWDLNYHNPAVLVAMLENLLKLANKGVEIFRLDAAIYIWKELGTPCRNLPQTHALLQVFRAVVSIAAPAVALKAEAVAGARHITKYFGTDGSHKKECQLAYHNAAMAALWDSLATGDVRPAAEMLRDLPQKPGDTSWVYYARCHDDIGWGTLRDRLGANWGASEEHLNFLWRFYAGEVEGSFARGQRFQQMPGEAFAGSNGTLASLAGLEAAFEKTGDAKAIDMAVKRILLLHAVPMALDGIPLIYMGDEIALLNDYDYDTKPENQDGRWLHRGKMPSGFEASNTPQSAVADRVLAELRKLIAARKLMPILNAKNPVRYLPTGNKHVLGFCRGNDEEHFLCVANFSEKPQDIGQEFVEKVLGKHVADQNPIGHSTSPIWQLEPYQCRWLVKQR